MQSSQLELAPSFQEGCHLETPATSARMKSGALYEWRMQCPASGLTGQIIGVAGLAGTKASVLLRVRFEDGRETQELLTGGRSEVRIEGESSQLIIALRYLRLGASHLFLGLDHLLFILCLILLATSLRSLLVTVSAFTLGHATTLGLASLGLVNVSEAWVEVGITLSIVVLAAELAAARSSTDRKESRRSPLGRHPWVVATGFGLLHGLGFASALAAVGLPRSDIFLGLFAFMTATIAGIMLAKLMNLVTKTPVNPMIGAAGVSAVPMAARVVQDLGREEDPQNFLLMHAMGPNVAGVIGTATVAGVLVAIVPTLL